MRSARAAPNNRFVRINVETREYTCFAGKHLLTQFIAETHLDPYEVEELRNNPLGWAGDPTDPIFPEEA